MIQKLKYLGLLVILPLFTIALSFDYIEAEAVKAEGIVGITDESLLEPTMKLVGKVPIVPPVPVIISI